MILMQAAVVNSYDAPPRYAGFDEPVPQGDELRVRVSAAGLHRVVKALANGTHYGSTGILPFVPGIDGVGRLEDGTRVYFASARSPFGTFAEYSVTNRSFCLPLPEVLDDVTVAAMMNPGMSSWAALRERARFVAGESVLILGATGTSGQMAVQIAKRLGARRVVAAGRNPKALEELKALGADAVISLGQEREALVAALRAEWAKDKIDVVIDYLWGSPAERVLDAIAQKELQHDAARVRYVQVGSSAGATISLPAATLRSSGLEMIGSGFGSVSIERIFQALEEFLQEVARQPFSIKSESAALRDVEALWNRDDGGARLVFQP
jgi:NADPH:quinone reductase-like Zn-dependent oxidoreductase